jgi:hypothetical protein
MPSIDEYCPLVGATTYWSDGKKLVRGDDKGRHVKASMLGKYTCVFNEQMEQYAIDIGNKFIKWGNMLLLLDMRHCMR